MRATAIGLLLLAIAALAGGAWWWLRDSATYIAPFPIDEAPERAADPDAPLPEPAEAEPAREPEEERATRGAGDGAPAESRAIESVAIDGRVDLWADFSVDAPLPPPDGEFALTIVDGARRRIETVRVAAGRFRASAPAAASIEFTKFDFGGRTAWLNGDLRRPVPADGKLRLIAMLLHDVVLQVVDADSEIDLRDVTVVAASAPRSHPGRVIAEDVLVDGGHSPITLPPFVERGGGMPRVAQLARLWVGAPNHEWAPARVDYTSVANHFRVPLRRAGSLVVELRAAQRRDPAIAASLQIQLWTSRGELPHAETPASIGIPNRIDGIIGSFDVVVVSPAEPAPMELGRAAIQVVAGHESRVTIEIAPPRRTDAIAIDGTVEIPSSWGELDGAMKLTHVSGDASAEEFPLQEMEVDRAEPRTLRFSAHLAMPGRWRATWPAYGLQQDLEIGPQGASDLRLRAPESAELRLVFTDAATRQAIVPVPFRWATGTGGADAEWVQDAATSFDRPWSLRVPVGPLAIWVQDLESYGPCAARFDVQPGINEQRIELSPAIGLRVKFLLAGAPVDVSPERCPLHPRPLEGDGQFVQWSHSWQQHELFVSEPGRWEITCDPLEGYAPVEPLVLELSRGGLLDVTIDLTRRG